VTTAHTCWPNRQTSSKLIPEKPPQVKEETKKKLKTFSFELVTVQISLWPILANSFVLSCHCLIWQPIKTPNGHRSANRLSSMITYTHTHSKQRYPILNTPFFYFYFLKFLVWRHGETTSLVPFCLHNSLPLHEFVTYVGYSLSEPARWTDDVKARDSSELNSRNAAVQKAAALIDDNFKSHDTYHSLLICITARESHASSQQIKK
jgi:nitrate reductase NapE component